MLTSAMSLSAATLVPATIFMKASLEPLSELLWDPTITTGPLRSLSMKLKAADV
jgi:hypothetical protein